MRGVAVTSAQEGIDTTAPAVRITSPTAGARVSGTTTVTASAVDDHSGVASVRFSLDGQPLGVTATAAPYQVRWGTTRVPNGRHTLAAVAVDAAGNTATAAPVTITVDNPLPVETSASADGKETSPSPGSPPRTPETSSSRWSAPADRPASGRRPASPAAA